MRSTRWAGLALLGLAGSLQAQQPTAAAHREPGIHPVLVVTGESAAGATLELYLERVQVAEEVASVQGELRFDPTRVRVTAGQVPRGMTGAWNQAGPGRIRFAGIAPEGIGPGPVLALTLAVRQPVAAETFELTIQELFSASFADLTPLLRQAGSRPILSRP